MESFHNKKQPRAKLAQGTGKSRDKIAKAAGIGRTLVKIAEVCEAAEAEPEKYGQFVGEMDRTGKVDGVYRKLRAELDAERRPMAELRTREDFATAIAQRWQESVAAIIDVGKLPKRAVRA